MCDYVDEKHPAENMRIPVQVAEVLGNVWIY